MNVHYFERGFSIVRKRWTEYELIITLAFYLLDKNVTNKQHLSDFSKKLIKVTGIERSSNTLALRMANYQALDPHYHGVGLTGGGKDVQRIWTEYVTNDPDLKRIKEIYTKFQKNINDADYIYEIKTTDVKYFSESPMKIKMFDKNVEDGSFKIHTETANYCYKHDNKQSHYNAVCYDNRKNTFRSVYSPVFTLTLDEVQLFKELIEKSIFYNAYNYLVLEKVNESIEYKGMIKRRLKNIDKILITKDIEFIHDYLNKDKYEINDSELNYLSCQIKEKTIFISFKNSYVRQILLEELKLTHSSDLFTDESFDSLLDFNENINLKLGKYISKTVKEISNLVDYNIESKSSNRILFNRMLNNQNQEISEFKKANIIVKTIRVDKQWKSLESMSFPAFDFIKISTESWHQSDLCKLFKNYKFLFPIFAETDRGFVFMGVKLWSICNEDLHGEIKEVWEHTQDIIKTGNIVKEIKNNKKYSNFKGMKDTRILHVRPHAKNAEDTLTLPIVDQLTGSKEYTKHCFWINSEYLSEIISDLIKKSSYKDDSTNETQYKIVNVRNDKCPEGYTLANDICYLTKFSSLYEALFSDIIVSKTYHNKFKSVEIKNCIDRMMDKKIIIDFCPNQYITVKYFMNDKISFSKATNLIKYLDDIKNKYPVSRKELLLLGISEKELVELEYQMNYKRIILKNEYYLIEDVKFTRKEAVKYLLNIHKHISEYEFMIEIQHHMGFEISERQLQKTAISCGGYYDMDFGRYFVNKEEYYKYVWN